MTRRIREIFNMSSPKSYIDKQEQILHKIIYEMLSTLSALEQPPHSSSKEEASAAEKLYEEMKQEILDGVKDIIAAFLGDEYVLISTEELNIIKNVITRIDNL